MRIATSTIYSLAASDIQSAQLDLFDAQRQVGSEKVANDLKGFDRDVKALFSARSFQARAESFASSGRDLERRLSTQDTALTMAADAVNNLRSEIQNNAFTTGRGDNLRQVLGDTFSSLVAAMNQTDIGRYVFSGVSEDTLPVNATSLATLPPVANMGDIFDNAQRPPQAKIDPNITIDAAPLAEDLSREFFNVLKRIYDYDQADPLEGQLDDADRTFLQARLTELDTVFDTLNQATAVNGNNQTRLSDALTRMSDEADYFETLAGNIENADLAEVATALAQAQVQIEAAASAFNSIRESSLLNLLR